MISPNKESKDNIVLVHSIIKSKHQRDEEGEKKKKKKTSINWKSTQEWQGWAIRVSLKHEPWVSSKMRKRNWMNKLLFHVDDTTMTRTWWDEKTNLGLERLSNQGWTDERPSFC